MGPGKWCGIGTGDEIKSSAHVVEGAVKEVAGKVVNNDELEQKGQEEKAAANDELEKQTADHEAQQKGSTAAMPDFKENTTLPVNDQNN